jgi:hypothetical protein
VGADLFRCIGRLLPFRAPSHQPNDRKTSNWAVILVVEGLDCAIHDNLATKGDELRRGSRGWTLAGGPWTSLV